MAGELITYASQEIRCKAGLTRVAHINTSSMIVLTSPSENGISAIRAIVKDRHYNLPFRCNDCPLFEEHTCDSKSQK